ncbi:uncharacterized protein LOC143843452 isoform X2 [Paroedura picta]|uniref:uncharacterized protein LOC143843452 isoform X2 n=1 Tax=Paroedura picta TaxID=143630 RepID=UPI0040562164
MGKTRGTLRNLRATLHQETRRREDPQLLIEEEPKQGPAYNLPIFKDLFTQEDSSLMEQPLPFLGRHSKGAVLSEKIGKARWSLKAPTCSFQKDSKI